MNSEENRGGMKLEECLAHLAPGTTCSVCESNILVGLRSGLQEVEVRAAEKVRGRGADHLFKNFRSKKHSKLSILFNIEFS